MSKKIGALVVLVTALSGCKTISPQVTAITPVPNNLCNYESINSPVFNVSESFKEQGYKYDTIFHFSEDTDANSEDINSAISNVLSNGFKVLKSNSPTEKSKFKSVYLAFSGFIDGDLSKRVDIIDYQPTELINSQCQTVFHYSPYPDVLEYISLDGESVRDLSHVKLFLGSDNLKLKSVNGRLATIGEKMKFTGAKLPQCGYDDIDSPEMLYAERDPYNYFTTDPNILPDAKNERLLSQLSRGGEAFKVTGKVAKGDANRTPGMAYSESGGKLFVRDLNAMPEVLTETCKKLYFTDKDDWLLAVKHDFLEADIYNGSKREFDVNAQAHIDIISDNYSITTAKFKNGYFEAKVNSSNGNLISNKYIVSLTSKKWGYFNKAKDIIGTLIPLNGLITVLIIVSKACVI
jgi:hypothetical protein